MGREMRGLLIVMNVAFWGVAGYLGHKALAPYTSFDAAGNQITVHPGSEAMVLPALAGVATAVVAVVLYVKIGELFYSKKNLE